MQAQRVDHFLLLAAEIALEVAAQTLHVECFKLLGTGAQVLSCPSGHANHSRSELAAERAGALAASTWVAFSARRS